MKIQGESGSSIESDNEGSEIIGIRNFGFDMQDENFMNTTTTLHKNSPCASAVSVRNVEKSYEFGKPVLQRMSMTVRHRTIYTLLGSSGCGKTSLLSCIVGLIPIDSGKIHVFGREPRSKGSGIPGKLIGYMPQEASLYLSLTIREILDYFGRLHGMASELIQEKIQFFTEFLQLPCSSQIVSTLSGGQKRRVSFAATLLPSPPLLVLDEPTVGTDPVLREKIWNYLRDMCSSKNTTVIVTTHYIEESQQSDCIGVMRNGRLLVEESPQSLLDRHAATLLSPVILELCQRDDIQSGSLDHGFVKVTDDNTESNFMSSKELDLDYSGFIECDIKDSSRTHLWAIIKKNYIIIRRHLLFVIFFVCVPAIQCGLFLTVIGNDPNSLPFGVVNEEVNDSSFCQHIISNSNGTEIDVDCMTEHLSCHYIGMIPDDGLVLYFHQTNEEAMESLLKGRTWGYMKFPQNYTDSLLSRTSGFQYSDNETYPNSDILFQMDASNKQITMTLINTLRTTFQKFTKVLLKNCGLDERMGENPLKFLPPVYGDYSAGSPVFLMPSLSLGVIYFYPILSTSLQLIREKKQGTLERTIVAGVKTWEILLASSITESILVVLVFLLGFFGLAALFSIPIRGSYILITIMYLLTGICSISCGFLIGTICTEEMEAALLAMSLFFPNFIMSGMLWPIEGITSTTLRYFVEYCLLCTLSGEAVRSMVTRGWGFTHPKVWPGFASLATWIVLFWMLYITLEKRMKTTSRRNF